MILAPLSDSAFDAAAESSAGRAPLPPNEAARLEALRRYAILDTLPEAVFDRITRLVTEIFDVPISTVTFIDAERQWFKSCVGLKDRETQRDPAFCAHAILSDEVLVVRDAHEDARFRENRFVTAAPHIRFYAGAPLITADGFNLGTVCLIDTAPREFTDAQAAMLADFAAIVTDELELRLTAEKLSAEIAERQRVEESLRLLGAAVEQAKDSIMITEANLDLPGPTAVFVNPAYTKMTGYPRESILGKTPRVLQGPKTSRVVLDRLKRNLAAGEDFVGDTINYRADGTEFHMEWRVAPLRNAQNVITHFVAIQRDISERKAVAAALKETHRALLDASRQAGMAEVATSVLHNVGNVLNSVNISATVAAETVRRSCGSDVARIAALLQEHREDLPKFLATTQGARLPDFLTSLGQHLGDEQRKVLAELHGLGTHIEHIKEIVEMQQTYARRAGIAEALSAESLVEGALRLNAASFDRHGLNILRDFAEAPLLEVDKHKALQILTNLIRNAKDAMDDPGAAGKQMTVRISREGAALVQISVSDQGVGIPADNLTRIFAHGFTTRKNGHGFGLHSAALAAREMGGSLTAQSDGAGKGAAFTLELPCAHQTHS